MNFSKDIEHSMSLILNPHHLKKCLAKDDAINHLSKARDLLVNLGFNSYSSMIEVIIKRAETIDESSIEVTI